MTIESFDPSQTTSITATKSAVNHFRRQLEGQDDKFIRLSVRRSGCTGYRYDLDLVDSINTEDEVISLADDFDLYVSQEAVPMLKGTEIDYQFEGLNRTLQFNNPNVQDTCGCGESFSVG